VIVHRKGEQVLEVRGDREHPLSRGYTCPKGRGLAGFHHHPARLDYPKMNGAPNDWETCLDDVATRCRRLLDKHGPSALGYYTSTGLIGDTIGWVVQTRFFELLGCDQRYTAATVDIAPAWRAAELVLGVAKECHPVWVPEDDSPRLVLMFGINPVVSHGYLTPLADPVRRIGEYRRRGGEVWVFDPRQTQTASLADRHVALRPGTDAAVFAWLVRELLADGASTEELERYADPTDVRKLRMAVEPFGLEVVAGQAGVPEAVLCDLLAAIRRARQIAAVSATGVTFGRHALLAEWLRWVLLIVTGSLDWPGGMRFDAGWLAPLEERAEWEVAPLHHEENGPASRPELSRYFGEVPCVAMVDEIEAGQLRGLFLSGGSPLTAFPDPARTESALRSLDLLVVVDVIENDHTNLASHVFPATGQLERSDLSSRGRMMYAPAVVPPVAERKPVWWMYQELGRRLGVDVLDGLDPAAPAEEAFLRRLASNSREGADALFAAGPHGLPIAPVYGWVHDRVLPHGRWRLAPDVLLNRLPELLEQTDHDRLLLVSRREVGRTNYVDYVRQDPSSEPGVLIHPDDAVAIGVTNGARVRVRSQAGTVEAFARIDGHYRQGVVALTHGWTRPNVDHLVSRTASIDPLTGQPVMSGIPVDISPVIPTENS
jgi:anaerobic selenocysteine-containing dehydrogenase